MKRYWLTAVLTVISLRSIMAPLEKQINKDQDVEHLILMWHKHLRERTRSYFSPVMEHFHSAGWVCLLKLKTVIAIVAK